VILSKIIVYTVIVFIIAMCTVIVFLWYGDGAGNTVEENSSVFSLIRMY